MDEVLGVGYIWKRSADNGDAIEEEGILLTFLYHHDVPVNRILVMLYFSHLPLLTYGKMMQSIRYWTNE
ncbi:unnamed protein product [marine sediment metagenome]|uniref:Uncharacterized protein n=1 Tax=marine sediment metagenome TaxID=412755 RepID=X1FGF3_9ZZZZ